MTNSIRTVLLGSLALICAASASSQRASRASSELKYIVIFSRHGIRSPTLTAEELSQYASEPWPSWDVAPGYLTAHGRVLMRQFGSYDRAYFQSQGLFHAQGCADALRVTYWPDNEQRTLETARAIAEGMLPGCDVKLGLRAKGEADPLFSPLATGLGSADRNIATAAILGRIGSNPQALLDLYRPELDELEEVLHGDAAQRAWLRDSIRIMPGKKENLVELSGPLKTASTLTENLLLEYTNGMSGKDLGWGRLDAGMMQRIMVLHTAYADLARRTLYGARARGSNLLFHILASLQQAASGKSVPGALGKPGDAALVMVGHDTNLSNLSGMLGISWMLQGYQGDDPVPGGALVFELWERGDEFSIRTYYTAQSLEQMRLAVPLTLDAPPLRAPVFIPACGTASEGFDCSWAGFQHAASAAIDPAFVKQ